MTTPKVQMATGLFIAALRDLQLALCEARSDGPTLAQTFAEGHTRAVVDEHVGLIEFAIVKDDGGGHEWIESIVVDYDRPQNWGSLASLGIGAGATQH